MADAGAPLIHGGAGRTPDFWPRLRSGHGDRGRRCLIARLSSRERGFRSYRRRFLRFLGHGFPCRFSGLDAA